MAKDSPATPPVVINISPMAHFAVGFFALGLLIPVFTWPATAPLLVIPVMLFGPPLALLLFGVAAGWAFRGFKMDDTMADEGRRQG